MINWGGGWLPPKKAVLNLMFALHDSLRFFRYFFIFFGFLSINFGTVLVFFRSEIHQKFKLSVNYVTTVRTQKPGVFLALDCSHQSQRRNTALLRCDWFISSNRALGKNARFSCAYCRWVIGLGGQEVPNITYLMSIEVEPS